jgi:hypothetical protein
MEHINIVWQQNSHFSVKDRMKQCAGGVHDPLSLLASSDLNSTSTQLLQTLKENENAIAENQRTATALEEVKHNAEVSETDEQSFACPGRCVCKDHQQRGIPCTILSKLLQSVCRKAGRESGALFRSRGTVMACVCHDAIEARE